MYMHQHGIYAREKKEIQSKMGAIMALNRHPNSGFENPSDFCRI